MRHNIDNQFCCAHLDNILSIITIKQFSRDGPSNTANVYTRTGTISVLVMQKDCKISPSLVGCNNLLNCVEKTHLHYDDKNTPLYAVNSYNKKKLCGVVAGATSPTGQLWR
jgi:hypothetical protein